MENSINRLKNISENNINIDKDIMNGDELLQYIQTNNYDSFLQKVFQNYESKITDNINKDIDDTSFLDTINSSINDLRIKLSFEFFRFYLDREEYKLFKKYTKITIFPTITLQNVKSATLYALNGLLNFSLIYNKYKEKMTTPIAKGLKNIGFDKFVENINKINVQKTVRHATKSTFDHVTNTNSDTKEKGGSKKKYKRNNNNNNKRKTKKIRNHIAKR